MSDDGFDEEDDLDDVTGPVARLVSFDHLSPTEFEEFCFDLMNELGFVNVDWRKGTPKNASPADHGRDIRADSERTEVDGHRHFETWFVDAKHYKTGVPPEALQGLFTWAQADRPTVALVIASGYLSNPAKDWIENYLRSSPPFRIRVWEKPQLSRMLRERPDLLARFAIHMPFSLRGHTEILAAEQEFFDKVWYNRKLVLEERIEDGRREQLDTKLRETMEAAMRRVEDRYGIDDLGPWTDFEWGMVNGKLSALRWVLGDDWDFLDT
jgi:hypothetical protein